MPTAIYILPDGSQRDVDLYEGQSFMEGAISAGIQAILGECGGAAMCATCHVYVEGGPTGALPPVSEVEDAMLDETASKRLPTSRLSCQIKMTPELEGLLVRIAPKM